MVRHFESRSEHWPLATPFRISRGVRTEADLVVVELKQGTFVGRGEGAPIPRYGDTVDSCIAQLETLRPQIERGLDRRGLMDALRPGAARNALDCALWDLEAQLAGKTVSGLIGPTLIPTVTAMTVGLDTVANMAAAAARMTDLPLVKVKVNADDPASQLRAVRQVAPKPVLIVDANESWTMPLLEQMQPVLAELKVSLLEQPLPASQDEALRGLTPSVPICADESCHVAEDLERLDGLYQAVNIKLDKTGGLTAALDLLAAARRRGLTVMSGCMICTSLSIAPLFHIATQADFADMDGPTWLARDRDGGVQLSGGLMSPPDRALWGG
jgi:L-alanine-DL-glutamate epimerase-like enolase superfamily enzyme